MTEEEALEKLRSLITYKTRVRDLAAQFGVSSSFMSMVLSGQKGITQPMAEAIGLRKVVSFEPIAEQPSTLHDLPLGRVFPVPDTEGEG